MKPSLQEVLDQLIQQTRWSAYENEAGPLKLLVAWQNAAALATPEPLKETWEIVKILEQALDAERQRIYTALHEVVDEFKKGRKLEQFDHAEVRAAIWPDRSTSAIPTYVWDPEKVAEMRFNAIETALNPIEKLKIFGGQIFGPRQYERLMKKAQEGVEGAKRNLETDRY